ncbi:MAG: DUF4976 domain-containing protein, partial [Pirellulales bacterium]|nr:DUF4976 domain-containing protein [Pirellulales bacterium]
GQQQRQRKHEYLYWEWPKYNWKQGEYSSTLWQAVRQGQWKLLRHDQEKPWQLYDLSKDLAEKNNLADDHPEIVQRMSDWIEANRTEMPPQIEPKYPDGKRFL